MYMLGCVWWYIKFSSHMERSWTEFFTFCTTDFQSTCTFGRESQDEGQNHQDKIGYSKTLKKVPLIHCYVKDFVVHNGSTMLPLQWHQFLTSEQIRIWSKLYLHYVGWCWYGERIMNFWLIWCHQSWGFLSFLIQMGLLYWNTGMIALQRKGIF